MKHHGAQYGVECCVCKWQLVDSRIFKDYVDARLPRLFTRFLDHLRRGVNPAHSALRADPLLGSDCEGSSPTAHIQNRLAGFQARQIDHVLTKGSLPAEPYHPKQKVISEGPMAGAGDCESMGISQAIERKEDGEVKLVATPNPSGRGCRNIHDY